MGNDKFLRKKPKAASSGNMPKNLKKNPGKRTADDTVYHDTDNDRAVTFRSDDHLPGTGAGTANDNGSRQ